MASDNNPTARACELTDDLQAAPRTAGATANFEITKLRRSSIGADLAVRPRAVATEGKVETAIERVSSDLRRLASASAAFAANRLAVFPILACSACCQDRCSCRRGGAAAMAANSTKSWTSGSASASTSSCCCCCCCWRAPRRGRPRTLATGWTLPNDINSSKSSAMG